MADSALNEYAAGVLAGTGLTVSDVTGEGTPAEGSAAYALRDGWDMARRADQIEQKVPVL